MKLHSVNEAARLYVIRAGDGFSCYGFEILDRKARAVAQWAGLADPAAPIGSADHFAQCAAIIEGGAAHAARTGQRCGADLTPELCGLEGARVEVTTPAGDRSRFYVGRSSGWMPVHLAISSRASSGGPAVYVPPGSRVRVIESRR